MRHADAAGPPAGVTGGPSAETRPAGPEDRTVTALAALQDALTAENAAIYGYGVVGAHLTHAEEHAARVAYEAHRSWRDRLRAALLGGDAVPAAAAPAYALPEPVHDAASARRLALLLEEGLAAAYAALVQATRGDLRALGASALQEAAVRAAMWRGSSVPFPGLPER